MELSEFWEAVALNRTALVDAVSRRFKEFAFTWGEDAVSATIIKLAPKAASIDGDKFFQFFYTAARHKLYDMWRRQRNQNVRDARITSPDLDDHDTSGEQQAVDCLQFFLARLKPDDQALLLQIVCGEQSSVAKHDVYHLRERKLKAIRKAYDEG